MGDRMEDIIEVLDMHKLQTLIELKRNRFIENYGVGPKYLLLDKLNYECLTMLTLPNNIGFSAHHRPMVILGLEILIVDTQRTIITVESEFNLEIE